MDIDTSSLNQEKVDLFWKMEDSNDNMYITGKAGSGKSFLLQFFKDHTKKDAAFLAPTGVAALNIGGQTIHSFFSLSFDIQDPNQIRHEEIGERKRELLREVETIVIDEVSMVRVDILDAIDAKLKNANDNDLPFGGKQIILFGDLFQLPPVAEAQVDRYLNDKYGSVFFFAAPAYKQSFFKEYELKTVFRQSDRAFVGILNDVRIGHITDNELEALNSRCGLVEKFSVHNRFVVITPTNDMAKQYNDYKLAKIDRQERTYEAILSGDFSERAQFPTDKELKLKVGAQVMMLVNDNADNKHGKNIGRRWVNGTIGIISELGYDYIKVMINGVEHSIDKHTWEKQRYEYDADEKKLTYKVVSKFTQFPVKLAYALTIHKAQGQTYKSVAIDLGNGAFAPGQTYVALSRCVSLDNLYLLSEITRKDIFANQEVLNFMSKTKDLEKEKTVRVYNPEVDGTIDDENLNYLRSMQTATGEDLDFLKQLQNS